VWIRHIEFSDAEGENLLFHLLRVIGLEFQVDCLQKVALIESSVLIDKAEVDVIQLKSVDFIGFYSGFAAEDFAIESTNPFCSDRAAKTAV
jgi:hypothetical protein